MSSIKKKALGKGLGALLGSEVYEPSQSVGIDVVELASNFKMLPITQIEANPNQPRTEFDEESLKELSNSISEIGIIQPLTVREVGKNKYQLISGERRFRASQMAGLTEVPAYIRTADDQEMLEMALIENIQRRDLNAIEVALTYKRLLEECNLTQEQLSKRVSKNRTSITNHLRLLRLSAEVQVAIKNGLISMGHARAIVNVDNEKWQKQIVNKIIENGLSVRAVEELVRKYHENTTKPAVQPNQSDDPHHFEEFIVKLVDKLNRNVEIIPGKKGDGKIVIPFSNKEELEKLVSELLK